jgi:hypothetical protein
MGFLPGQVVRFREPADADEAAERYRVIEDRDTRVLVGSTDPAFATWRIPPTFVLAAAEITLDEDDLRSI